MGSFLGETMDANCNSIFIVSLPTYKEKFRNEDVTESMKEDGYYDDYYENGGRCFFRVTEEEYLDITEKFSNETVEAGIRSYDFTFKPKLEEEYVE